MADVENYDRLRADAISDLVANTRQDQVAGIQRSIWAVNVWCFLERKDRGLYFVDYAMCQAR